MAQSRRAPDALTAATDDISDQPAATLTPSPESHPSLTYDLTGAAPTRAKRKSTAATRRQIAHDRQTGASIRELTQRYGLTRSAIHRILNKEGVPRRAPIIGEQHRAELERLRRQGLSTAQIASRFGVNASTALRAMRRLGVS